MDGAMIPLVPKHHGFALVGDADGGDLKSADPGLG